MPKKIQAINQFDKGIINSVDKKDIPEGGVANSGDLMFDIKGQARQMGSESIHRELLDNADIDGRLTPGYGLFAFNSDFNVSDNHERGTKMLAIQAAHAIGIHDINSSDAFNFNPSEIDLRANTGSASDEMPSPIFSYVDGALRVCDSNFNNSDFNFPKSYSYLRKEWFSHLGANGIPSVNNLTGPAYYDGAPTIVNGTAGTLGNWTTNRSFIYPPSVNATGTATHQLYTGTGNEHKYSTLAAVRAALIATSFGSIALTVNSTTDADLLETGEWTIGKYYFGISFQYDSGQESQVSEFHEAWDGTSGMSDNTPLAFNLHVSINAMLDFDSRISGINLYWTGDEDSKFSDPLWIGYWYWGTNTSDKSYFESHAGDRVESDGIEHDGTSAGVYSTNGGTWDDDADSGLVVKTLPALTFELKNLYNNETESIASKYQSIIITNKFLRDSLDSTGNCAKQCHAEQLPQNLDRMIKSPVNQFDVFPNENFIDVAVNDGESITHLMSYNDRILQFKENTLYVLNISGDMEYLEAQHKYMGVQSGYQVVETESGIAWVNPNGCFLYKEGEPINIAAALLFGVSADETQLGEFVSWTDFIGNTGMIGYIPSLKQLVVMQDPSTTGTGDVLIFDIKTKSWAFGYDKCTPENKSNIVMNYDNSCLYISQSVISSFFQSYRSRNFYSGVSPQWKINNLSGSGMVVTNLSYSLGGRVICESFSLAEDDPQSLISKIKANIDSQKDLLNENQISFNTISEGGNLTITRNPSLIEADSITYNGQDLIKVSGEISDTGSLLTIARESIEDGERLTYAGEIVGSGGDVDPSSDISLYVSTIVNLRAHVHDTPSGLANENIVSTTLLMLHTSLRAVGFTNTGAVSEFFDADSATPMDNILAFTSADWDSENPSLPQRSGLWHNEPFIVKNRLQDNSNGEAYSHITLSSTTNNLNFDAGTSSSIKYLIGWYTWLDILTPEIIINGTGINFFGSARYYISHSEDGLGGGYFTTGGLSPGWTPSGTNIRTDYENTDVVDNPWVGADPSTQRMKIEAPSVVFRVLERNWMFMQHPEIPILQLGITMIGNHSDYFIEGLEYNIENEHFSEAYHFNLSGDILRYCRVSSVKVIKKAVNFEAINYSEGMLSSRSNPYDYRGAYLTLVTFDQVDQSEHSGETGSADALWANWDNLKSYGSQSNVNFERLDYADSLGIAGIINTNKTGIATRPEIHTMNPRYNGVTTESSINATLTDHAGQSYSTSLTVAEGDPIIGISEAIMANINDDNFPKPSPEYKWDDLALHVYTNSTEWLIGMNESDNGCRVRVALDLASYGVGIGDAFQFSTINTRTFFINDIYAYGFDAAGVADVGYTTFDIDKTLTQTNAGALASSAQTIEGDLTYNEAIPSIPLEVVGVRPSIKFSNIIMTGQQGHISPHRIGMSLVQTGSINVNQFINDPGFDNTNSSTSRNIKLETKRFDLGAAGTRKSLTWVDITYKATVPIFSGGTAPKILAFLAIVDDLPSELYQDIPTTSGLLQETGLKHTNGVYVTQRFYFNQDKSPAKGKYISLSIQELGIGNNELLLNGFAINDISISFRELAR